MTESQNSEKLIILNDVADGLMARIYNLIDFQNEDVFTSDVDKFTKTLVKKFPLFPDSINKGSSYDVFVKRAAEVSGTTLLFYNTFLDILNFTDEAWRLIEIVAATTQEFKWDMNPDIMSFYFRLLTSFVKLHLLVNQIKDRKYYIAAYSKAHQLTNGNSEPNMQKVADYLSSYEKPLDQVRNLFSGITQQLGTALMPLQNTIYFYSDCKSYKGEKRFLVVDDAANMTKPVDEQTYLRILNVNTFREWVLFTFLVIPAFLQDDSALRLLQQALKHDFVVPLFRNKTIRIMDEYVTMFDKFQLNKFKLSKHKKIIKDAYNNWEQTLQDRIDMRIFLRVTMNTNLAFFTEFPAAIAPKIQMLWALIRLARDEVNWSFYHLRAVPYGQKRSPTSEMDPQVSHLIYYVHSLSDLLKKHEKVIAGYYLEYLRGVGAKDIYPAVETFRTQSQKEGANLSEFNGLIDLITNGLDYADPSSSMEAIRLNWYRVSAACTSNTSGIMPKTVTNFSVSLTKTIQYTRNVDGLKAQIKTHCSFSVLYWFEEDLTKMLSEILRLTGTARNCISFVRLLNNALHNIHLRLCPEEQMKIGLNVVNLAKKYLSTIVEHTRRLIEHIAAETHDFRNQSSPNAAISNMKNHTISTPGEESSHLNKLINKPRLWKKAVSEIVGAIAKSERITIFNTEFSPREFLIETITDHTRTFVRNAIRSDASRQELVPPAEALDRISDFILAYQNVEYYININIGQIVREIFLGEFSADKGGVGDTIPIHSSNQLEKNYPVIHDIAHWYQRLLKKDLSTLGISYSHTHKAFVHGKKRDPKVLHNVEVYTDKRSLEALAKLVGPYGLRVIDSYLMEVIQENVGNIKQTLTAYKTILDNLRGRFSHRPLWFTSAHEVPHIDFILSNSSVIGQILQFRRDMRDAQYAVANASVPFVQKAVQLAWSHITSKKTELGNEYAQMDILAQDVGLDTGMGDAVFRAAIATYCTHQSDYDIFDLLPELYGISFSGSRWRNARFQILTEGHDNNSHCMALCITSLLIGTKTNAGLTATQENPNYTIELDIQEAFQRFIKNASYSLLHMSSENNHTGNISHMMVFLEQFINHSGGRVDMAYLEQCFPFNMIRQNFIQLHEDQSDEKTRYDANANDNDEKEQKTQG